MLQRIQVNVFFKLNFPAHYEYLSAKQENKHFTSNIQSAMR